MTPCARATHSSVCRLAGAALVLAVSLGELAAAMGRSEGAVKQPQFRALPSLGAWAGEGR